MKTLNLLPQKRILSIDVLRGITILTMIFVNEVAGMKNIPEWMKHMAAEADGMTFVDVVFPAFLFIVGMSVPLALNQRIKKGDNFWQVQWHIFVRAVGLLVLGVFMVNAEGDYNEAAMGMSIYLWSLCFYVAVVLVWNTYSFSSSFFAYLLRALGILMLIVLALIYRAGDGSEYLQPRWWGILGLIGWAYLYTCILYQLVRGNIYGLLLSVVACIFIYIAGNTYLSDTYSLMHWTNAQAGNAAHTSIVLCGLIVTLVFFDEKKSLSIGYRISMAASFAIVLFFAGYVLRPYFKISKIYATPTWCLYSAGICTVLFVVVYWIVDIKRWNRWTDFFKPAASNPLLTYIIPFVLWAVFGYFGFYLLPEKFQTGIVGIFYCILYAVAIMWVVKALNKLGIKLQL